MQNSRQGSDSWVSFVEFHNQRHFASFCWSKTCWRVTGLNLRAGSGKSTGCTRALFFWIIRVHLSNHWSFLHRDVTKIEICIVRWLCPFSSAHKSFFREIPEQRICFCWTNSLAKGFWAVIVQGLWRSIPRDLLCYETFYIVLTLVWDRVCDV